MYLLDAKYVVETKTKQSVHGDKKKSYNFIESYFSRKVFYRNKNVFAMCLQLISQITYLGLKKIN